ncbi:hypothetical protein JNK13_04680 [bacterium]|nr:hypothetical protein [bacterium]
MSAKTIQKILVANRGEIARRIFHSCRKLGKQTVAIYTRGEEQALHVLEADESFLIPSDSYLDEATIIEIAKQAKVDAIHPGYGFLAEKASFAEKIEKVGIIYLGPTPESIETLGSKDRARALASKLKISLPSGLEGSVRDLEKGAAKLALPLMIKAAAGGGGRGMRIVQDLKTLPQLLESAAREAESSFGDGTLLLERYIPSARHIEVQLVGDGKGNVIHLYERECSLQRRYQKVIEEAPAANLPEKMREQIFQAACKLGSEVKLRSLATVEFLVATQDNGQAEWFFLECNTRIQVEHPVTESITGLDLVEIQIYIAETGNLPIKQDQVTSTGHAIEARLCAEIPELNFQPGTGVVNDLYFPEDDYLRIDHALAVGLSVTTRFDSLLAKVITYAETRPAALEKLSAALRATVISGIGTNTLFLLALVETLGTGKKQIHTTFIEKEFSYESNSVEIGLAAFVAAPYIVQSLHNESKNSAIFPKIFPERTFVVASKTLVSPTRYQVKLQDIKSNSALVSINGRNYPLTIKDIEYSSSRDLGATTLLQLSAPSLDFGTLDVLASTTNFEYWSLDLEGSIAVLGNTLQISQAFTDKSKQNLNHEIHSPLPGKIVAVRAQAGDKVASGTPLIVLESMKIEHLLLAPRDITVGEIFVSPGDQVEANKLLVRF